MEHEIYSALKSRQIIPNAYPMSDLDVFLCTSKCEIESLNTLMDMGWVIMSTWIEDEDASVIRDSVATNISIRLGKETTRLILCTDLPIGTAMDVIPNMDADDPGAKPEIITGMKNSISKLRATSISGYGPYATRYPGLRMPMKTPKLSVIGLDIEMSTAMRTGMPLSHDPMISIVISNGGWYDKEFEDKCYCLHSFGFCSKIDWEAGRHAVIIKMDGDEAMVRKSYEIINGLCPDFVNIHNGFNFDLRVLACVSAMDPIVGPTFQDRRLGNVGVGIFWKLENGSMVTDSMYTASADTGRKWKSFGLGKMAEEFDLPPKMDGGTMKILPSDDIDVSDIIRYNARDSDLHAWLPKNMMMCERLCMIAGCSRGTLWDSIANNTGVVSFCTQQSVSLSKNAMLDLGRNSSSTDDRKFEGGYVVPPIPGIYRGVVMIDGNSLYASLISKLQIFVDRCASSDDIYGLERKVALSLPQSVNSMQVGDVVWNENVIVLRSKYAYLAVVQGEPTILDEIISELICMRADAKAEGDMVTAGAFKLLAVSIFGVMGSKHAIMSAKACAEAVTCAARYYLRNMIAVTNECGYKVIYGDTDSIFAHVGGMDEHQCMDAAQTLKTKIDASTKNTPFALVGADVKGNYKAILITGRKMYTTIDWDGNIDTKGMTPVKKDKIPIAKYAASKVLEMLISDDTYETRKANVTRFVGKLLKALEKGEIPATMQVTEVKVNCQPHYAYKDTNGYKVSTLVDMGIGFSDVNKEWVVERITGSIESILEASDIGSVRGLVFSYNSTVTEKANRYRSQT